MSHRKERAGMELVCGDVSTHEVKEEIPFVCSIIARLPSAEVGVTYEDCQTDRPWEQHQVSISTAALKAWIENSIRRGVYIPGYCDLIISGECVTVKLCHECDIHVETKDKAIIEKCVSRWLEKGYRVSRKRVSAGKGWKAVWSVEDAVSALDAQD